MNIIGLVLFVFILLAQLSKGRTTTPLQGRPFEGRRLAPAPPTVKEASPKQPPRPRVVSDYTEEATVPTPSADTQAMERPGMRAALPSPSLYSAVIWAEILDKPVSKRRKRI